MLPHSRSCQTRRTGHSTTTSTRWFLLSTFYRLLLGNTCASILCICPRIYRRHRTRVHHLRCHNVTHVWIETLLKNRVLASMEHVVELLLLLRVHRATVDTCVSIPCHKATCVSKTLLCSIPVIWERSVSLLNRRSHIRAQTTLSLSWYTSPTCDAYSLRSLLLRDKCPGHCCALIFLRHAIRLVKIAWVQSLHQFPLGLDLLCLALTLRCETLLTISWIE